MENPAHFRVEIYSIMASAAKVCFQRSHNTKSQCKGGHEKNHIHRGLLCRTVLPFVCLTSMFAYKKLRALK
jgi:hypothetical protein